MVGRKGEVIGSLAAADDDKSSLSFPYGGRGGAMRGLDHITPAMRAGDYYSPPLSYHLPPITLSLTYFP